MKKIIKNKLYVFAAVSLIAVAAVFYFVKNKNSDLADTKNEDGNKQEEVGAVNDGKNNYLEGVLTVSDDMNKGNLKLASKDGYVYYIRTSRDFSKLFGLEVLALINGTVEKFELVDIQTKVESNGYLLQR